MSQSTEEVIESIKKIAVLSDRINEAIDSYHEYNNCVPSTNAENNQIAGAQMLSGVAGAAIGYVVSAPLRIIPVIGENLANAVTVGITGAALAEGTAIAKKSIDIHNAACEAQATSSSTSSSVPDAKQVLVPLIKTEEQIRREEALIKMKEYNKPIKAETERRLQEMEANSEKMKSATSISEQQHYRTLVVNAVGTPKNPKDMLSDLPPILGISHFLNNPSAPVSPPSFSVSPQSLQSFSLPRQPKPVFTPAFLSAPPPPHAAAPAPAQPINTPQIVLQVTNKSFYVGFKINNGGGRKPGW